MANYFTDQERNFADKDTYADAPVDYEDAIENYRRMLEITGDIAANILAPNSESVDLEGPHLENGRMIYASKTVENMEAMRQAGLWGITMPRRYGGLNVPETIFSMASEIVSAADSSFQNIWSLQSCCETLYEFGSEEQRQKFIPRICAGETMSMDLTEPDAGSDLQRVMLKATWSEEEGCWLLNGVKRFITNGDSDIHLVLARSEEGTRDGRGLSMFIYDKRQGGVNVRHIEHKLGIHGSPTCELTYKKSTGLSQEALNEAIAYAREREQFSQKINRFPGVYDMLSRMKAKLDGGRSLLYTTSRYVDVYKALEDIQRERPLTAEERAELKKYSRLADAFTPMCKGMTSEYANQNAYDSVSVHGGSGFIMEYKCQRLFRDARIFSIYEGTTQLQVVAAIRYIINGTWQGIFEEMLGHEVSEQMKPLQARISALLPTYLAAIEKVKADANQEEQDFLSRRLYDMTGVLVISLLLLDDATKAPELFAKSAEVYVRHAEAEVSAHSAYVMNFKAEDLASFRVAED